MESDSKTEKERLAIEYRLKRAELAKIQFGILSCSHYKKVEIVRHTDGRVLQIWSVNIGRKGYVEYLVGTVSPFNATECGFVKEGDISPLVIIQPFDNAFIVSVLPRDDCGRKRSERFEKESDALDWMMTEARQIVIDDQTKKK